MWIHGLYPFFYWYVHLLKNIILIIPFNIILLSLLINHVKMLITILFCSIMTFYFLKFVLFSIIQFYTYKYFTVFLLFLPPSSPLAVLPQLLQKCCPSATVLNEWMKLSNNQFITSGGLTMRLQVKIKVCQLHVRVRVKVDGNTPLCPRLRTPQPTDSNSWPRGGSGREQKMIPILESKDFRSEP